jgi:hypothetical protein
MSDHWNSLANLLGTPSLSPPKPKSESSSAPNLDTVPNPQTLPSPTPESSSDKLKGEKSRLKTSWDAVANFFGVASKDSEAASVESMEIESNDASPDSPIPSSKAPQGKAPQGVVKATPRRKGKPSMWSDEMDLPPKPGQKEKVSKVSKPDLQKSETQERDVEGPRERLLSDDEPQRRSHRRPPRRSREKDGDASLPPQRDESPSHREERAAPSRSESRSERPASPQKLSPRSEMPERKKSFGFGVGIEESTIDSFEDREDDVDIREEKTEEDRLGSTSEEQEGRTRRRRRRGGRNRKRDDVQDTATDRSRDRESDRDTSDREATTSRRSRQAADSESSEEEDAPQFRQSKIPSWSETIGVLVEANMLNHQRSSSQNRGNPRGRGRR